MRFATLSGTDLRVSAICLGTMSYGFQLGEAEAHEQMDLALDLGIQFWDTAEMYPVPATAERAGETERIIGTWLQKTGRRKEVVLASKILGPSRYEHQIPEKKRFTKRNMQAAVDGSLRRLQTDSLDLYQLHWPDRAVNAFGRRSYSHLPEEDGSSIEETLEALDGLVKSGKVRYVGLSNETPWGTMEFLRVAREKNLPRMASVQNVYSLLNRHYEVGMSEVSLREDIGLLAYSPLGYGVLGGRYLDGASPQGGRFSVHPQMAARYRTPGVQAVTKRYADLARRSGLTPAQMALAFVAHQPFVTSTIIGASTLDQLREDAGAAEITLSDDVLQGIEAIQAEHPNPVA